MEENEVIGENQEITTYTQEQVDEMLKKRDEENEKAFDEKFNKRWGNKERKYQMDRKEEDELINLLKEQTGKNSISELLDLSYDQYKIERPVHNDEDMKILGKYDAQSILNLEYEDIEAEANRLSQIKRTPREEATFTELGNYLKENKLKQTRIKEIKENGIDESILNDSEFNAFMNKFNNDTSIKDIVDIYNSTKLKKQKPFNAGSLKSQTSKEDSEFFTEEEFMALTAEDMKNPKIFEKARRTSLQLNK